MIRWQRVILVLVALAAASGGYVLTSRRIEAGEPAVPASAQLIPVRRGNLTVAVTTAGNVFLPRQAKLSFGVGGTIQQILVKEGAEVKAGQVVAALADIPSLQSAVAQANANVKQAQKNLEDARKQSPTAVPQAEQAVANARLALQNAQKTLDKAKVTDPLVLAQREKAVADARLALQNAQDALEKAKVVDPVVLSQRQQAVESARVALQSAQEAADTAKIPFTQDELTDAKEAVAAAQHSRDISKRDVELTQQTWEPKIKQAGDNLDTALQNYRDKVKGYYGVDLAEAQAYQDPSIIVPDPNVVFAWQNLMPKPPDQQTIDGAVRTSWQALITARDARDNQVLQRDKAISVAQVAERQAKANLQKAQETLDDMVVDSLQVALKQAQLATAKANLQKAVDDLADIKKGPDLLDVATKQAQVSTAQANLQKALEDLDETKKGPDPLDVALKQAQAATAQANVQKALEDLELAKQGPDPLLVELRQAQLASAQESLNTAQQNLAGATLVAPFSGTVNSISLKVGERVGTNSVVLEIVDNSEAEVRANLDEADLSRVKVGQRVNVSMDALPGVRIAGRVAYVALLGSRQAGVVTYPLRVTMTAPSGVSLRDGITATLGVVVEEKRDVLLVPSRALKRQGRDWVAQVMVNGQPENRTVTVGATSDQQTEVVSGLEAGERVAVTTATRSATGQVPGGLGGGAFGGGGIIPGGGFR